MINIIKNALKNNNIIILYGISGSGKTYNINLFATKNNYHLLNISNITISQIKEMGISTSFYKKPLYYIDVDKSNKKLLDYVQNFRQKLIIEARDKEIIPKGIPIIYQKLPSHTNKVSAFISMFNRPPTSEENEELKNISTFWDIKFIGYKLEKWKNKKNNNINNSFNDYFLESISKKAPIKKYLNYRN